MFTTLGTDTGLNHSTSQIHFYNTGTALFSSAVAIAAVHAVRRLLSLRYIQMVTRREHSSSSLTVHLACMPLHVLLEYSTALYPVPFQSIMKTTVSPCSGREGT